MWCEAACGDSAPEGVRRRQAGERRCCCSKPADTKVDKQTQRDAEQHVVREGGRVREAA